MLGSYRLKGQTGDEHHESMFIPYDHYSSGRLLVFTCSLGVIY